MKSGGSVWVPIVPTQYESAEWVRIMNAEREKMLAWCHERGLFRWIHFTYDFVKCLYKDDHCHVFYFDNPSDAVLFKLTFGGVAPIVQSQGSGDQ